MSVHEIQMSPIRASHRSSHSERSLILAPAQDTNYQPRAKSKYKMDPLPAPIVLLFAMAITLAVFVPLTGVLVRFRANYNPKGLQLDSEGGATPYTGPIVNSYFGMMIRVYRLEVSSLLFLRRSERNAPPGRSWSLQGTEYVHSPSILHCH